MALLIRNIGTLLTLKGASEKQGRRVLESDLGLALSAAVFIDKGQFQWIGSTKKIPKNLTKNKIREIDFQGQTMLPGFVECHTHTVFAGSRAAEFELRNQGVSYAEIAAKGGGILSTMSKTRKASLASLISSTQDRVDHFVSQGVTTLEIKSGYALNLPGELKMLQAAQGVTGPRVVTTFLGAHALPPEFTDYGQYLKYLGDEVLPAIKKKNLSNRVDVFIEKGFFPLLEAKAYLQKAKALGFQIALHADQITLSGGSELATELGALSGDHLIQIGEKEISKLSKSEVTCVLLPAADLYMRCAYPPARALIDSGARVALATDFNPGTSPTQDLNLVGLLARLEMKMTLPEVIAAYTMGGAYALGLQNNVGSIEVGKSADFLCTTKDWQELFYSAGEASVSRVFRRGKQIFNRTL